MKLTDFLLALCVPLIWGMGLVVAKPMLDDFPPILLMALRFALAALVLVWFVPIPRGYLRRIALISLFGASLQYALTFNGLKLLDAGTTALIVQVETPMLMLIGAIWLKEKIGPRKLIGCLVAFAGVYVISGAPSLVGKEVGIALVLTGCFIWAIGQAMYRRLNETDPGAVGGFTAIAWIAVLATPQLFALSLIFEGNPIPHIQEAPLTLWGAVVYLAVVMTVLGYGIWYHMLGRFSASLIAPFLLLVPVSSVAGGWLFLEEDITATILAGGALVMVGVGMLTVERRARSESLAVAKAESDSG